MDRDRRRPRRRVVVGAVVAAIAAAVGVLVALIETSGSGTTPPHHAPSPVPRREGVNFNCIHAPARDRSAVFRDLGVAGVAWVRINLNWDNIEPARGKYSGSYLGSLDRCVAGARAQQLKVLIVFLGTPAWARSGGSDVTPPRRPSDYARAIGFLASRYRTEVAAWEIWNEENNRFFWSNGSARDYVRLLRASYRAVKRAAPRALVVFGGTLRNDAAWLRACYRAGAKGSFDVMATHPYPAAEDVVARAALGSVRDVRRVMRAHGDEKPIWFTELGWSAPFAVSVHEQAAALTNALDYTTSRLRFVKNVFWFEAKNEVPSVTPRSWQGGLSLISPGLTPRPAFDALAHWIRSRAAR